MVRNINRLVDGGHRVGGAKLAGLEELPAIMMADDVPLPIQV